jgi:hypothetical protein
MLFYLSLLVFILKMTYARCLRLNVVTCDRVSESTRTSLQNTICHGVVHIKKHRVATNCVFGRSSYDRKVNRVSIPYRRPYQA